MTGKRKPGEPESLEQPPVDGLSPGVLLVIIQQVSIEYLLCAWYCPGLLVLHLGKEVEDASRSPGIRGKELLAMGTARQRPEADTAKHARAECGRGGQRGQSVTEDHVCSQGHWLGHRQPPLPVLGNVP